MSGRRILPPSWVRGKGNIRKVFLGTTREVAIFLRFEKHLITLGIARPSNIFDEEKNIFDNLKNVLQKNIFLFFGLADKGRKRK